MVYLIGFYIIIGCIYSLFMMATIYKIRKCVCIRYNLLLLLIWPYSLIRIWIFPKPYTEEELKEAEEFLEKLAKEQNNND